MSAANIALIIVITLVLLLIVLESVVSKNIEAKLTNYLYTKKWDEYEKLHNSFVTKYLFNPFNLKYIDLNKYGIQGDIKNFEKTLEEFDKMRLNKKQKEVLYNKAFFYFVMKKNKTSADRYYHLLKDLNKPEIMPNIDLFHDTFVKGGHKYLDDVKKLVENANDYEKADYESILAQIYDNMGNEKSAKKYTKLAEEHFSKMEKDLSKKQN